MFIPKTFCISEVVLECCLGLSFELFVVTRLIDVFRQFMNILLLNGITIIGEGLKKISLKSISMKYSYWSHSAYLGRFVPHQVSDGWCKAPLNWGYFRLNLKLCCSVFKFKTMQFWAHTSIKIKRRRKIVYCINKRLLYYVETSKTFYFLRSILLS